MRPHPTARELLAEIEHYLQRSGVKPSVFGVDCMGDGNYLQRLRAGRTPRLQTVDRVRAYLKRKART